DGQVVDLQLAAGDGGGVGAAAEGGRETAADGQVEDDEEGVVDRLGPGGGVHPVLLQGEVVVAVEVPADPLGRDRAVDLDGVGVEAGLAAFAGALAAAEARGLAARAAGVGAAVQGAEERGAA